MKRTYILGTIALYGFLAACSSMKKEEAPVASAAFANASPAPTQSGEVILNVSYMDKSVRPQDDFFSYANGTWVKNNPIPPSESRWGSFNELEKSNQKKLTQILEDASKTSQPEGSTQALLGNYYTAFMNMDARNSAGLTPIKEDLVKIQRMKSTNEIAGIVAYQHSYRIESLFAFGVDQDLKNVNSNISYLSQAGLGLPNKDYYLDSTKKEIVDEYTEYIRTILKLAGSTEEKAKESAKNIVHFETELAKTMMSPAELRVPEDN